MSSFAARAVSPSRSILFVLRRCIVFCGLGFGAFAFAQTTPPEPIVVTFTDLALERTYTGLPQEHVSWSISPGTPDNYTYKITYNGSTTLPKNAGTYTVKIVGTEKFAIPPLLKPRPFATSGKDKIIIAKAPLTVRAAAANRLYGSSNPKLSFSYEGFLNGETFAVLNTKPTVTTTVKSSTPAGVYPGAITVVGGSDNNYVITERIPADFTIAAFVSGTHEALVMDSGEAPVGKIEITLPIKGDVFTGRLYIAEETTSYAFSGKLVLAPDSLSAKCIASVKRPAVTKTATPAYQYDIGVTVDAINGLSLTLDKSIGSSFYTLGTIGKVRVHVAKTNPAPWEGAHTFSLYEPTPTFGFFGYPQGDGYATAVIGADGKLTLKGKLADGTSLTGTLYSDANGGYRVYLRPYGGRLQSDFGGFLQLLPHPTLTPPATPKQRYYIPREGSERSIVFWRKAAGTADKSYPDGIEELYIYPALDPWLPPAAGKKATTTTEAINPIILAQRLGLVDTHTETATFMIDYGMSDFGIRDIEGQIARSATLAPNNAVRSALPLSDNPKKPNPAGWSLSVNPSTGTFSGGFTLLDQVVGLPKPNVTRTVRFEGILRQLPDGETNDVFGAGFVVLEPLPIPDMFTGSATRGPSVSEPVRFSPLVLP